MNATNAMNAIQCLFVTLCTALIGSLLPLSAFSQKPLLTIPLHQGLIFRLPAQTQTLFIADDSIADLVIKAPHVAYITGRKLGSTVLYATDEKGKTLVNQTIKVVMDMRDLADQIRKTHPNTAIDVSGSKDSVILKGQVDSPEAANQVNDLALIQVNGNEKKIVNRLETQVQSQIHLKVSIVEMDRSISQTLGLSDWQILNSSSGVQFLGAASSSASWNPITTRNFNLNAFIQAMDQKGLTTILAEPNLTALSGQRASFLAGGEFPVLIPQGTTGVNTVDFKKFGVSLDFIPTLLDKKTIHLQVRTEVSQLSTEGAVILNGIQIPALKTRRADTAIQLRSGESFAIAGLIQNTSNKVIQQVPGLGSVPILGNLFRSRGFQNNETELIVIVTPYLVGPVGQEKLATPLTGMSKSELNASYGDILMQEGYLLE